MAETAKPKPGYPLNASTMSSLLQLAKAGKSVLLTGPHGIGKTSLFDQICKELGYVGAYVNCPLTDYVVDWLGIPFPAVEPDNLRSLRTFIQQGNHELATTLAMGMFHCDYPTAQGVVYHLWSHPPDNNLQFLRPKRLQGVNFVFLDELNRGDERFLDSCMELVQFGRVNGVPCPDLKLVWAGQNPAGGQYHVKELDIPLTDKFDAVIDLVGHISPEYFLQRGHSNLIVTAFTQWYSTDLSDEERERISPRKLESLMGMAGQGLDVDFAYLRSQGVRPHKLRMRLSGGPAASKYANLKSSDILANPLHYADLAKTDVSFQLAFTDILRDSKVDGATVSKMALVFINLPDEYKASLLTNQSWMHKMTNFMKPGLPPAIASVPGAIALRDLVLAADAV